MGNWAMAVKEFSKVEHYYPKSYLVPESLLGLVLSSRLLGLHLDLLLALVQRPFTQRDLFVLVSLGDR